MKHTYIHTYNESHTQPVAKAEGKSHPPKKKTLHFLLYMLLLLFSQYSTTNQLYCFSFYRTPSPFVWWVQCILSSNRGTKILVYRIHHHRIQVLYSSFTAHSFNIQIKYFTSTLITTYLLAIWTLRIVEHIKWINFNTPERRREVKQKGKRPGPFSLVLHNMYIKMLCS